MINQFTKLFSMLTTAIASPNKRVLPTFSKRKFPIALLLLGVIIGFPSAASSAWGWPVGVTSGDSGSTTSWGSRLVCPYGGFPLNVARAVDDDLTGAYPVGASGIRFDITLQCTEVGGASCVAGENGIRTVFLPTDSDGFIFDSIDKSITRTAGSFRDDGFKPDMKIGIRTPSNGINNSVLNEVTIVSGLGAVTDTRIYIVEDTLNSEGTLLQPGNGSIFSSRVNGLTSGFTGCFITPDDGNYTNVDGSYLVESPLQVDQAYANINYLNVTRECFAGLDPTCDWTANVLDTLHSIDGYIKIDDGKQLVNHGCAAGEPCTACLRNPDTLKKKEFEVHYATTGDFATGESVTATEKISRTPPVIFTGRYATTGAEIGDETICSTTTVVFAEKGNKDRSAKEVIEGVVQISGTFESEVLNIASNTGTTKYTFSPGSEFSCADIDPDTVSLENTSPLPGSAVEILGNRDCRAQFDRGELIANIRASSPGIADGDIFTLVANGEYDKDNADGFTPPGYCAAIDPTDPTDTKPASCVPFQSRDSVIIQERFNETITFSTASSEVQELADTSTHFVEIQVAGGNLNGIVTLDVADTLTGSANKRDYVFAPNPATLVFDPNDPETLTQTVEITVLANSPNNEVDTVILRLINISGPASLKGAIVLHTVTISD